MSRAKRNVPAQRRGGQPAVDRKARPKGVTLDSWAGRVHVEWDPEAPLTPLGQASFFIEFLPWLRHVPAWFPGTVWQKKVQIRRGQADGMLDDPYNLAKDAMVSVLQISTYLMCWSF